MKWKCFCYRYTFTSWDGSYLLLQWFLMLPFMGLFPNIMTNVGRNQWATWNGSITPCHFFVYLWVDRLIKGLIMIQLFFDSTGKLHFVGQHFVRALQKVTLITGSLQDSSSGYTNFGSRFWNSLHILCFKGKNHGIMWFLFQFPIFPGCCHRLPSGYICINHFLFPQFWSE